MRRVLLQGERRERGEQGEQTREGKRAGIVMDDSLGGREAEEGRSFVAFK
jgi:hypothetical protein